MKACTGPPCVGDLFLGRMLRSSRVFRHDKPKTRVCNFRPLQFLEPMWPATLGMVTSLWSRQPLARRMSCLGPVLLDPIFLHPEASVLNPSALGPPKIEALEPEALNTFWLFLTDHLALRAFSLQQGSKRCPGKNKHTHTHTLTHTHTHRDTHTQRHTH